MGFPTYSPMHDQLPSVTIFGGTRLSLTLADFDKMYLTAVADEHLNWKYVEHVEFFDIDEGKIKV